MSDTQWILPEADPRCGKVFFSDFSGAECHRIAREFWDRATGRTREGYRLAVYRCRRCGGFHIARRRMRAKTDAVLAALDDPGRDRDGRELGLWSRSASPERAS